MPAQQTLLTQLAMQVGEKLSAKKIYLATAESCTGGGLGAAITAIAGSSVWYERGFITYSNAAKVSMLDVAPALLTEFGAVSEPVAQAMAEGALQHSLAQVAIAITGIAGPDGGTDEKPVGTVCFAVAQKNQLTKMLTQYFAGAREAVRSQAVLYALELLLAID